MSGGYWRQRHAEEIALHADRRVVGARRRAAVHDAHLQGVATGLASGPLGAALIEPQTRSGRRAPAVTGTFSTLGLALGALITSAELIRLAVGEPESSPTAGEQPSG